MKYVHITWKKQRVVSKPIAPSRGGSTSLKWPCQKNMAQPKMALSLLSSKYSAYKDSDEIKNTVLGSF